MEDAHMSQLATDPFASLRTRPRYTSGECEGCGKTFSFTPRPVRKIYCSHDCRNHGQYIDQPEDGERRVDGRGYAWVGVNGHFVPEHRHVMEQKIGRSLIKGENVHHVNGIRNDNRPENLELWLRAQPHGQRVEDKIAWAKELLSLYVPHDELQSWITELG
jgi:hypothetical protein